MASNLTKFHHTIREGWIVLLLSISLITSCILISPQKPFWNDELYSWYLIADPSLSHMLQAFGDKINNTPLLYFLSGWFWAKLFGASELSLRLFSSVGFCIGGITTWIVLRKTYGFWSSSIGCLAVFCTSNIVLVQNAEARMYGLFVALCALGILLYHQAYKRDSFSKYFLLANIVIQAAIIHTHLFGLFYSGGFLLAFLIRDIFTFGSSFLKQRTNLYASFFLAWSSFIFYLPAFLVQSDAGKPYSWIPKPILQDLLSLVTLASTSFMKFSVLTLIFMVAGLQFFLFKGIPSENQYSKEFDQKSLLLVAYVFLGISVFVWCFSLVGRPIFYDRYLIPSILGWAILVAHSTEQLIKVPTLYETDLFCESKRSYFWIRYGRSLLPLGLALVLLLQPIAYAKSHRDRYIPGTDDNIFGYEHLPIVVQASASFLERRFYAPDKDRYFFILDWEATNTPTSGLFGIQEHKHLEAINRQYPNLFSGHILTTEDFLKSFQEFLVLDYANYTEQCSIDITGIEKAVVWDGIHCPQWVEKRLLNNPSYEVVELGEIYGQVILRVRAQG